MHLPRIKSIGAARVAAGVETHRSLNAEPVVAREKCIASLGVRARAGKFCKNVDAVSSAAARKKRAHAYGDRKSALSLA
jgi:hypothetical protein